MEELEGVEYKQEIEGEVGRGQDLGVVVFAGLFHRVVTPTGASVQIQRGLTSGRRWGGADPAGQRVRRNGGV